MSVNTINKLTNKKTSFIYSSWVKDVVENGLMDNYIILKYPELVQVVEIKPDKSRENYKVLPKREAINLIGENNHGFDIIELDIEKIKLDDLNRSRYIKNKSLKSNQPLLKIRKTISDRIRPITKPTKNKLKQVGTGEWIIIALTIIIIILYIILN